MGNRRRFSGDAFSLYDWFSAPRSLLHVASHHGTGNSIAILEKRKTAVSTELLGTWMERGLSYRGTKLMRKRRHESKGTNELHGCT